MIMKEVKQMEKDIDSGKFSKVKNLNAKVSTNAVI